VEAEVLEEIHQEPGVLRVVPEEILRLAPVQEDKSVMELPVVAEVEDQRILKVPAVVVVEEEYTELLTYLLKSILVAAEAVVEPLLHMVELREWPDGTVETVAELS
jgi:hypothetical protein